MITAELVSDRLSIHPIAKSPNHPILNYGFVRLSMVSFSIMAWLMDSA